jgi:5-methylcytosine-specific restriction endonuclease McrA
MTAREQHNRRPGRTSSWIRRVKRLAIYLRDEFRCAYCGEDLRWKQPHEMGLDHLIPQSDPRCTNHESNLVLACRHCNSARQDRPWREFATAGAVKRIMRNRRRIVNAKLARAIIEGDVTWPQWEDR